MLGSGYFKDSTFSDVSVRKSLHCIIIFQFQYTHLAEVFQQRCYYLSPSWAL